MARGKPEDIFPIETLLFIVNICLTLNICIVVAADNNNKLLACLKTELYNKCS